VDHSTIHEMVSSMLSAAIKRQYNSVLPLLHRRLPVFDEICQMAVDLVFFSSG